MREIKFRGKSVETGEWIYGDLVSRTGYTIFSKYYIVVSVEGELEFHYVDRETVGQFTCLKDKNGVEIYEGDIVSANYYAFTEGKSSKFKGEIIYDTEQFIGYRIDNTRMSACSNFKVIGNIYENKELLK